MRSPTDSAQTSYQMVPAHLHNPDLRRFLPAINCYTHFCTLNFLPYIVTIFVTIMPPSLDILSNSFVCSINNLMKILFVLVSYKCCMVYMNIFCIILIYSLWKIFFSHKIMAFVKPYNLLTP